MKSTQSSSARVGDYQVPGSQGRRGSNAEMPQSLSVSSQSTREQNGTGLIEGLALMIGQPGVIDPFLNRYVAVGLFAGAVMGIRGLSVDIGKCSMDNKNPGKDIRFSQKIRKANQPSH